MRENELPLFEGLPEEHVDWALRFFRLVDVDFGMRLIEEGEEDPTLLCVLEGELEIRTGDTLLGVAKPGDIVGEMALFGEGLRMASVETNTNSRLLLLDRSGYQQLRNVASPVSRALEAFALEQLMQRLATTSDAIANLSEGTPAAVVTPQKGFFSSVKALFGSGGPYKVRNVDIAAVLRKVPFFVDAPDEALAEVAECMTVAGYASGSFLCTEGTIGQEMYILAEGLVEVIISTEGDRVEQLATLEPGDAFGMIALLDSRPRMASVVAKEPVTVLVLRLEQWQDLVASFSPGGSAMRVAMIRCVSDQLAFANAQLTQLEIVRHIEETRPLKPLFMAEAHMEAHGRTLTPAEPVRRM